MATTAYILNDSVNRLKMLDESQLAALFWTDPAGTVYVTNVFHRLENFEEKLR